MTTKNLPDSSFGSTKKNRLLKSGGLLTVLAVAVGSFYLYQADVNPNDSDEGGRRGRQFRNHENDTVPVAVKSVGRGDFPVYLTGLGTVTALRTVNVKPRVDGELVDVHFEEGQWVKAGDLLAEVDPRPFQIQLQQAEGQLLRDEALLKNAEIDRDRYQTLLEQDSIAAQQTQTQAALVKQYQGNIEMDRAQVNNAKLQLSYAKVTAPISGRVGLRQIDQGNIVRANDANGLVVITQLQPIDVVFTLPEDKLQAAIQRWRTNPAIKVEAYDRSGKTKLAEGKLKAIDNQIDPSTGTIKLKAQFDNREQTLFANQFVNIKMQLDTLSNALQVSTAAIQHDNDGAYLFVVGADQTVQQRRVTLGPIEGELVVVTNNLAADEVVVVDGIERLKTGSKIDVAEKDGVAVAAKPDVESKLERKPAHHDRRS